MSRPDLSDRVPFDVLSEVTITAALKPGGTFSLKELFPPVFLINFVLKISKFQVLPALGHPPSPGAMFLFFLSLNACYV